MGVIGCAPHMGNFLAEFTSRQRYILGLIPLDKGNFWLCSIAKGIYFH